MTLDDNKGLSSATDMIRPSSLDFETLLKLSNDALIVLSSDGTPTFISPAAERLFGWSTEKLSAQLRDLVYVEASNSDAELLHQILSGTAEFAATLPLADLQLRTAFGPLVWTEVSSHILRDESGAPEAYAVYFRNIARQKELESQLEAASQTDPLTGLFNRRAFEDSLKREWAIALREQTHTSLIKVSLDRFDAIAEHYGSNAAETCLAQVAKTLKETARRPADVAARTATSEFSLLLPRTHEMGVETISAYIHQAIQDLGIPNADNKAGNGIVTASVGAACTVPEQTGISENSEFILAAAESCVFQARQEGGNRVKTVMNYLTK
ncbi:diguanylate cyclase [uncultured Roseibium sp.]|uniref:GGDEF domain-containing protein n=1 Tax=uncultured Roseibium sp. TaxID=1936171 RepID=UPI00260242C0|nr:diguanylate cyclase [uncultured Roseibium sp.]